MSISIALNRIAPQSGTAFTVRSGQTLRIVDPLGRQVADLAAFSAADPRERLSTGRSIDYAGKIYLTTGDILYSGASNPMFTLLRDDVRRHDLLLVPCSQRMFELLYDFSGHHPSCQENLERALLPFGITASDIAQTFNVFMDVGVSPEGRVAVNPPRSRAGDVLELRAEMDLIVGLTACSAELTNDFAFKPIDWAVYQ